jgi:crotonobetainyl-CoA:carnitine CoA-transferase CaiB-like acyl-CoA transferase
VYPGAEGRWLALSVANEREWQLTLDALGRPPALDDPRFATEQSRYDARDDLDARLAAVTADRDATALASDLTEVGVAAAVVAVASTLITDRHLADRGFFVEVEHPDWGRRRLIGLPWRIAGGAPFPLGTPPLLEALDEAAHP